MRGMGFVMVRMDGGIFGSMGHLASLRSGRRTGSGFDSD